MKAIVCTKYGTADVLRLVDIEIPTPKDNEVLIKVHAASLNATDMEMLHGSPFFVRLAGLRAPMYKVLGSDICGRVEAVGSNVTQFRPGDVVFGDLSDCEFGGLAEYVCGCEDDLALKPPAMSDDDAAAVPQAGVLALQGLRDNGRIQPGYKVLINGAGGGAGTFAVQIAKLYDAEVTAVDHPAKLDMIRSLGADHVIDYTRADFTKQGQQYDLILDTVAQRSMFAYRRVLSSRGSFVMLGGATGVILQAVTLGPLLARQDDRTLGILMARQSTADLLWLAERVADGRITPIIGGRFPLSKAPEAMRQLEAGQAIGKLVITMGEGTAG